MLRFLFSSWRSKELSDEEATVSTPSTPAPRRTSVQKSKLPQLNTSIIGPPIRHRTPNFITGFDVDSEAQWSAQPSPVSSTRSGPSHIAWLRTPTDEQSRSLPSVYPPPPAVVRVGRVDPQMHPVTRSVSSPMPYSLPMNPNGAIPCNGRPLANQAYSGSTHSLRLEHVPPHNRPFTSTFSYPTTKPLSPIVEQEYFSPDSLRRTIPLPPASETNPSTSTIGMAPTPSPASDSTTRPSPVHSHPFITRSVNRSISQASHKSNTSVSSSISPQIALQQPPPSLPPLDLRPPFPGPHPSAEGGGPQLRPKKSVNVMPTITAGSSDEYDTAGDTESFITATEDPHSQSRPTSHATSSASGSGTITPHQRSSAATDNNRISVPPIATTSAPNRIEYTNTEASMIRSEVTVSPGAPSPSESFIRRRWDRDALYGNGIVTFRVKRQKWWANATPAFWAFWWGFLCPVLWLIGGWHFTNFGEQPPRLTFWEFYFNMGYWKEKVFCVRRKGVRFAGEPQAGLSASEKGKSKASQTGPTAPPLTRWVSEKQSSDFRRARLNDPKRSLRGIISFGYPFVPRPAPIDGHDDHTVFGRLMNIAMKTLSKPNRCFDQIYGVKLTDVQGKREGARRMFDPWIQRCRYAFCYGMLLVCAGLATATALLLIMNTRDLSS